MRKTHVRAARELRNNFSEIARLLEQHDQVIITKNGTGAAVMINFDEYAAYEEYLHKKYVLSELKKAQKEAQSPDTKWLGDDEFWTGIEDAADGI
ncbi:MAG: type II toxin-antitoxin system Phd/YefM family antitoxin [Papillibacter sp.]|nr:type II toxin-antitoxin system Phd/YefM family antitoxin [Papillibacter sp.]